MPIPLDEVPMEPVTIVMTTYFPPGEDGARRRGDAERTLDTWITHLWYKPGKLHLHVADDGSDEEHWTRFSKYLSGINGLDFFASCTTSQQVRRGVGASLNAAMPRVQQNGPLWLYAVDDWELVEDFDLRPWAALLMQDESVGMVRLGPPHPWLTGEIRTWPYGWGMLLDRHHFAFGHRPALYHWRMTERYGWFYEGVNAYECERHYNDRFCQNMPNAPETERGPSIVLALLTPWSHVDGVELAHVEPRA